MAVKKVSTKILAGVSSSQQLSHSRMQFEFPRTRTKIFSWIIFLRRIWASTGPSLVTGDRDGSSHPSSSLTLKRENHFHRHQSPVANTTSSHSKIGNEKRRRVHYVYIASYMSISTNILESWCSAVEYSYTREVGGSSIVRRREGLSLHTRYVLRRARTNMAKSE